MNNVWQLWGIFQQDLECAVYTNESIDDVKQISALCLL